jgi:NADPH2:quinone reductase
MDLPDMMRAIVIREPGGPDVLMQAEVPVPAPGEGEVLIEVAAAGVNRPDVLQREGRYPPPPGASPLPGLEVAGMIVGVGAGVDQGAIGERVCSLVAGGGYAEYVTADYAQCLPVPAAMRMEEAAAMPETLMTVWHNLFERAYVMNGDSVLIHGGTSGIGTMAISLCKLFGITSIVTVGSEEKRLAALEWGAGHAINYRDEDFVEAVKRFWIWSGATICRAILIVWQKMVATSPLQCWGGQRRRL